MVSLKDVSYWLRVAFGVLFFILHNSVFAVVTGLGVFLVQPLKLCLPNYARFVSRYVVTPMGCRSFRQLIWLLENWGRITLRFSGDNVPVRESAIVICNHVSYSDWMWMLSLAARKERVGSLRFLVADWVKWLPGLGWGLWLTSSIFLQRDWAKDERTMQKILEENKRAMVPMWVTSFCEGVLLDEDKVQRSQAYARKNNLPVLSHVLLPRTRGFVSLVKSLRTRVDAVYDITLGYPEYIEGWQVMGGFVNKSVHMHVRRHAIASLPTNEDEIEQWLIDRYVEKDRLLADFKLHNKFPGKNWTEPVSFWYEGESVDDANLHLKFKEL